MALRPGELVLVQFPDDLDELWHERLLLAYVVGPEWVVVTLDDEVEVQDFRGVEVRFLGPNRRLPCGVKAEEAYMVYYPNQPNNYWLDSKVADYMLEGQNLATLERESRGLLADLDPGRRATGKQAQPSCHLGRSGTCRSWGRSGSGVDGCGCPTRRGSGPRAAAAAAAGPPAGAAALAVVVPVAASRWVVAESGPGRPRGQDVVLNGFGEINGRHGIKMDGKDGYFIFALQDDDIENFRGAEAGGDARLMPVSFHGKVRRRRAWRDVVALLSAVLFEGWPVPGPRTVAWCARYLDRRGGGPLDHHHWWRANHALRADDWGVAEHETGLLAIELAGGYDGMDITNVAALEVMMRRAQLVEYAYSDRRNDKGKKGGGKDSKNDKSEAAVFSGIHRKTGEMMVAPELLEYVHVSREIEKDASIMKQIRKAREERRLLSGTAK